jgi:hypothetical protein
VARAAPLKSSSQTQVAFAIWVHVGSHWGLPQRSLRRQASRSPFLKFCGCLCLCCATVGSGRIVSGCQEAGCRGWPGGLLQPRTAAPLPRLPGWRRRLPLTWAFCPLVASPQAPSQAPSFRKRHLHRADKPTVPRHAPQLPFVPAARSLDS